MQKTMPDWTCQVKLQPAKNLPPSLFQGKVSTKAGDLNLLFDENGVLFWSSFQGLTTSSRFSKTSIRRNQDLADKIWKAACKGESLVVSPIGTDFQQSVWAALLAIPCGETRSYSELAKLIGHPNPRIAARAIGQAVGANPIVPFIPCHRVIATGGLIGGYSGGSLQFKQSLLEHEGAVLKSRAA